MRVVCLVLLVVAAGCTKPGRSPSKRQAKVDTRGEVQQGVFSADDGPVATNDVRRFC